MASHAPMLAPIVADAGARGAAVFIDLTETHSPKKEAPDLALAGASRISCDEAFWNAHTQIRALGRGSFASVVLARNVSSGLLSAVKIVDKEAASNTDEDSSPDYRREAEILSTINHPNVVTLHSVSHSPTTLFLLMEPAAGDLRAHVAALPGGVCSEPEARRLFSSLLSAVSHLHDRSIVHRDIKLSNVLLSAETGDVLLADFGLAERVPAGGLTAVCGTHDCLAPEMVRCGHGDVMSYGVEVDLWAAGLLLYALLFGRNPFERETEISTLQAILAGDYVLPAAAPTGAAVGAAARELIAALLVTDPAARPGAADALAHAWLAPSSPGRASSPVRLLRRLLGGDGNGWRPRFELRSAAPPAVAASPLVECAS